MRPAGCGEEPSWSRKAENRDESLGSALAIKGAFCSARTQTTEARFGKWDRLALSEDGVETAVTVWDAWKVGRGRLMGPGGPTMRQ